MSQATCAVVGVYESMKDAEAAVATLLEQRAPAEQVSVVGQDLHSETQVHGLVTTGDVATRGSQDRRLGRRPVWRSKWSRAAVRAWRGSAGRAGPLAVGALAAVEG